MDIHDSTTTPEKFCNLCEQSFPPTDEYWYRHKRHRDGWSSNCKNCDKARAKRWADKYPERVLANVLHYQVEHPEETRQKKRRYYEKNKPIAMARARAWNRTHPETINRLGRIHNNRRRAWKRKAEGTITAADIRLQYKSQKGLCWWCGKPVGTDYHADHVIPLARGGTNKPENIVISCPKCNMSKGSKLPHEWNGRLL